jgi:dTDP-4-amino-4,6-dideoxygalactose transaminase
MSSPDISQLEKEAVEQVMASRYLSMGEKIGEFENAICEYTGSRNAIAVSSGTAGLHLCVRAAGIKNNDLIITTPFSFVSSTNVILFENAIPVFVDVDPDTGNIDPVQLSQAVADLKEGGRKARQWLPRMVDHSTKELKAMIPVDVFGQPADYDRIKQAVLGTEIQIIEDSCEALGAKYKGTSAGTLGNYGVFAFYPNKQITTGEGGMVITDDDQAAAKIRALRNQGRIPGDSWLDHSLLGFNYRLDELSSAIGWAQMSRIDDLLEKRSRVAGWYDARLEKIAGIKKPFIAPTTTYTSWFVYVIQLEPGIERDMIINDLATNGIPSRPYFSPIHLQDYMVEMFGYRPGDYPVTEKLGGSGLALPFSGVMTEEQVETVCRTIQEIL